MRRTVRELESWVLSEPSVSDEDNDIDGERVKFQLLCRARKEAPLFCTFALVGEKLRTRSGSIDGLCVSKELYVDGFLCDSRVARLFPHSLRARTAEGLPGLTPP
mmetsp:Transcript_409/g.1402  ORF Transcript_409/g.1402 Transcript_409/m.1402 type:complete len:105 (-) Transcript_409:406-720(-)|eukprot:scaffold137_cov398-Prasinococcus_capsulatus_cf.AAC.25